MEEDILNALKVLEKGGTILYPTDTIWGIGCDATNSKAVEKIFKLKRRPLDRSFIILIDSADKLSLYLKEVPQITLDIMKSITTPLTIVYPNAKNLAKNVIAPDKTIAIRVTQDEFCQKLIGRFGKPIVSTSANLSGTETPFVFNKIATEIVNGVSYVVKIHQERVTQLKQSTIIKLVSDGEFSVIRK